MIVSRIKNIEHYRVHRERSQAIFERIWRQERELTPTKKVPFSIRGISYPAKSIVDFHVDFEYSNGIDVNWRERLVCPITGLNNRLRASIHFADFELGLKEYHNIYISEQVTPLYNYVKTKIPRTTGSEFLDAGYAGGFINPAGIRHEDMTRLSFQDEEFDFYLSFECFEHIPDFNKGFREAFRVLKPEGIMLFTVPFITQNYDNVIRAFIDDSGEICHILPPEYHGNPISEKGSLCYTHFGWEMLDQLRSCGFTQVYALTYWSDTFGYMGGEQILFFAVK